MSIHDNQTDCKMCGLCCKAIPIFKTEKELADMGGYDAEWIRKYWKRITQEEAHLINPHQKEVDDKHYQEQVPLYFTCTLLVNNKCSKHDERPYVCKNYPWYSHDKISSIELIGGRNCGFAKYDKGEQE